MAAKGEHWLIIATLYLCIIIIVSKIWLAIRSPVYRICAAALLVGVFITMTTFTPCGKLKPLTEIEENDSAAEADVSFTDADNQTVIDNTDLNANNEMASLDDLISNRVEENGITTGAYSINSDSSENSSFDKNAWNLLLVNKEHPVPEDYTFTLGVIKGSMKCDERILNPLTDMFSAAALDGINLIVCSPYRDLTRQEYLFNRKMKSYLNRGYSYIDAYKVSSSVVTVPGASEHQIGISLDIICDTYSQLNEGFGETAAGKWLVNNSYKYGFILRYPKDKEEITGIIYEPWHFRYVGIEAATVIHDKKISLEEFINSI